jgi:hypothetical protein
MSEVNRRVAPHERLVIYGAFNSDPVIFYRGQTIEIDERPLDAAAAKIAPGDGYIITTETSWQKFQSARPELAPPLLQSKGKGPEGDAPLVLLRAKFS